MHVSPIGFKGTITVIDKSKGRTTYLESYHTSKKQDEELFRLAYNTLGKVGIKKDLATTDVVDFKNKLEQIMIKSFSLSTTFLVVAFASFKMPIGRDPLSIILHPSSPLI